MPTVLVFTLLTLAATLLTWACSISAGSSRPARGSSPGPGSRSTPGPALMVIILVVQARTPGGDPPRSVPLPGWVCGLLAVQAVVLLGLGVALFAAPGWPAPLWPWKLTPLIAQATGAWLIGLGVAAAHALAERDAAPPAPRRGRLLLLAVLQAIALARYPDQFEWSSAAG